MTKARLFGDGAALLILGGAMAAAVFFAATRDRLFFHSDPWSLGLTLTFLGLLLAAAPLLLWAGLCIGHAAAAARLETALAAVATWALLTGFPVACIGVAAMVLRQDWALALMRSPLALAATMAAVMIVTGAALFRARNRRLYWARTRQIARALALAILVGLPAATGINHVRAAAAAADEPRLTVLLVLDALPARYMSLFGWDAPETELDRQFAEADVLLEARSSAVWTFGWFGTLYSGSSEAVIDPLRRLPAPDNLLARVQRADAMARWMAFHQNGIPEASAGHVNAYNGLRSSFLTPRYAWIPRALGLDYHLVLPNAAIRSLLVGPAANAAFRLLNPGAPARPPTLDTLSREVAHLAAEGRGGLLIYHTHWRIGEHQGPRGAAAPTKPPLWAVETDGTADLGNYFYDAAAEAAVAAQRAQLTPDLDALGASLRTLRRALAAAWPDGSHRLLVTADHGSAFEQGRLNYGYHPIEAVVQVPLAVYGDLGEPPATAPMDARDLNALLARIAGNDPSVAAGRPGATASITLKSDANAEWFVILADGKRVIRANIHPESAGGIETFLRTGYALDPQPQSEQQQDDGRSAIAAHLSAFGLADEDVHPHYRGR